MVIDAPNASPRPQLWRISDRKSFEALRRSRARARSGCCSVTFVPPADVVSPPRVAFAVGKTVGGAVARNRIRRRLRAAVRELQRGGRFPSGTYLFGATADAGTLPWSALLASVDDVVQKVAA